MEGTSMMLRTRESGGMIFKPGNTERMRILNSGNVGIGTNNPAYKLDVNGNIRTGEALIFSRGGTQDPYIANTGDSKDLMFYTADNERVRITQGVIQLLN
jgi:hypothetical protein